VFRKFQQLGSARQATIWFREEQILLPKATPGTAGQEVILHLHWAGGIHTELRVERNKTGQHRRSADRTVIELVSELSKVVANLEILQHSLA
jgi:hypothetical protein